MGTVAEQIDVTVVVDVDGQQSLGTRRQVEGKRSEAGAAVDEEVGAGAGDDGDVHQPVRVEVGHSQPSYVLGSQVARRGDLREGAVPVVAQQDQTVSTGGDEIDVAVHVEVAQHDVADR